MIDKYNEMVRGKTQLLPLERWTGYRLGLIAARVGVLAAAQYTKRFELTTSLWRVLAIVARFEPLSATTLCEHSRLDPPRVSRAIDALVARKVVLRRVDASDQRKVVLTLSAKGRRLYQDVAVPVCAVENQVLTALSAAEQKQFWHMLSKIDKQLSGLAAASLADVVPAAARENIKTLRAKRSAGS
jgi:DNA-binding MarR family transcriptional regulator